MPWQSMFSSVQDVTAVVNKCASVVTFPGSCQYWERRYLRGRSSGDGSYGQLAEFKAEVLNQFVRENQVTSVIEFGCGDGHQLAIGEYPQYIGLDVSATAAAMCRDQFESDKTKSFFVYDSASFTDNARVFCA